MANDLLTSKLTNRFYITYYCLLLYLLAKTLDFYYFHTSQGVYLIVSTCMIVLIIILSLVVFLYFKFFTLSRSTFPILYFILYTFTGLIITFTESSFILYMSNHSTQPNHSYFPMAVYICLGSKDLLYTRRTFYISSLFNLTIFTILSITSSASVVESIYTCLLLFILVIYKAADLQNSSKIYKILITENDKSPEKKEEIKTPMDEIMVRVKFCMEKIEKISQLASPKHFKIFQKMKTKLEFVTKELHSPNIYSPKFEVLTKNMDQENKLYIEQELLESHSISYFQTEHIHPRKIPEYDLASLKGLLLPLGKEWNFNTFFLSECTSEIINVLGEYTIKLYRLDELLKLNVSKLKNLLTSIQENYYKNPYHNSIHAADVLCSFVYLLNNTQMKKYVSSFEWLGNILACLAHDLKHPAKNNRYIIMTQHEYSVIYNDISVLENMHASTLFLLLKKPDNNIFEQFLVDKFFSVRKLIVELILATDMSKHFEIVSSARTKHSESIDLNSPENRLDMFKLIIKSADIGHTAKCNELHLKWCYLVIEEFFTQGDLEKQKGIPVSMFCDRENTNIGKSQAGFIKNIALILFETLNLVLHSDNLNEFCILQLKSNLRYWENHCLRFSSEKEVVTTNTAENNGIRKEYSL